MGQSHRTEYDIEEVPLHSKDKKIIIIIIVVLMAIILLISVDRRWQTQNGDKTHCLPAGEDGRVTSSSSKALSVRKQPDKYSMMILHTHTR